MSESNRIKVIELLRGWGIDANRVPQKGVSREGFQYWPDDRGAVRVSTQGYPVGTEFREWPTPTAYDEVATLMGWDEGDSPDAVEPANEPTPTPDEKQGEAAGGKKK